ncbi:hypothetical protein [Aneurinibacillus tyrosinisolvens]|nr:hypothetical protein [Aneurinibacillus tyrosinisolvens]
MTLLELARRNVSHSAPLNWFTYPSIFDIRSLYSLRIHHDSTIGQAVG